ncbi:beta-galactosidase [Limobrevibacterium gyesilva]|uniref:Beta-galactosidase n=1 Tax=Limobrevibacterium gyesilva TaxID=2991712 RepID=A0AA41YIZ4_9PROT|nr:beta-galactosidase [Limobrevibacterium gyesilva]MCW3474486.1 beta-galactosidase [Limobrevibacterium gyesilva]
MVRTGLLAALGFVAALAGAGPASADTLKLPAQALERSGLVLMTYSFDRPVTGTGSLDVEWTDTYGRVVLRRSLTLDTPGQTAVTYPIDLGRAVAMQNHLRARLTLDGQQSSATLTFVAKPPAESWDDYRIMMWHEAGPPRAAALRSLSIAAGKVFGIRDSFTQADVDARIAPLLQGELRWFVENIATDFYAPYHRWTPEHPEDVNWLFTEAQRRHRLDPSNLSVFRREPSLSDPAWIARIQARLADTVRAHAPYRPYYYDLGDETGIADLTAAWDFDLSAPSLAAFRAWLRLHYGMLGALNRQWGTAFANWDAVVPLGTTAAMLRADDNFSAWADFKVFMDDAFARALRAGTEAVHAADPTALAAIEGAQMPGWGGYDYSRLAGAVDVMEMFDGGQNIAIAQSLNPKLVVISTASGGGAQEQHRIWQALLHGQRGLVLWDDGGEIVGADGQPGPRGRADAALFAELRSGLGAQVIAGRPHVDPVAILYSPASFRTQWLLDQRPKGDAWTGRSAEIENEDNAVRAAMRRAALGLSRLGLQPRWLSSDQVERGGLREAGVRALVLPHAIALSPAETLEIRTFAESGGVVLADGAPGLFDAHSRRLAAPLLQGAPLVPLPASATPAELARLLAPADLAAGFTIATPGGEPVGDVDTRVLTNGAVTLLGLQRAYGGGTREVVLTLPQPVYAHDLRRGTNWQHTDRIRLALDPVAPTLLALSPRKLPAPVIDGPSAIRAGETAELRIGLSDASPAASHVLRVDAIDPSGQAVAHYSGNVILRGAGTAWRLPLAVNDMPGAWTIRVRDVLGGEVASLPLAVAAP